MICVEMIVNFDCSFKLILGEIMKKKSNNTTSQEKSEGEVVCIIVCDLYSKKVLFKDKVNAHHGV